MKLKYILTLLVAACALAIGCSKPQLNELAEVKLSQSTIGLPAKKIKDAKVEVEINAVDAWKITTAIPEWLSVEPLNGPAGKSKIVFKPTKETEACNTVTLKMECAGKTQYLLVQQGIPEVKEVTCKEILDGPDGATYKVTGLVSSIAESVKYGNWYITDDTGTVYIYGTKDSDGQTAQGALVKYGLEVGDKVTIEGPKTTYGTTVELVDVTVIKIVKSLVKVCNENALQNIEKEGASVGVKVIVKGGNLDIRTAQSDTVSTELDWVKIGSIKQIKAVKEADPDTTVVNFTIFPNEEDVRAGIVSFASGTSTVTVPVSQKSGLSAYQLPYNETFAEGIGAWEINDIKIAEGKTYVWQWNTNKYMKASSGAKADAESYLESPLIDLGKVTSAHLSFDHVSRYAGNVYQELTLWVSANNGESWEQLLIPNYSTGSDWNFVNSGNINLTKYAGNQIKIRFKYISSANYYATWEIKNLAVAEGTGELKSVAEIALMGYNNSVTKEFEATLTDAVVTYVNGNNAFIEDKTGGLLLYKSGHGLVAGQKITGKVTGKITFYGGFAEATDLNVSAATVTSGATITPKELTIDALNASFNRYISCCVVLKGVKLDKEMGSNRNATVSQGTSTIPAYAKIKNDVTIAANVEGDLICWPCMNNTVQQVGIWSKDHFTSDK